MEGKALALDLNRYTDGFESILANGEQGRLSDRILSPTLSLLLSHFTSWFMDPAVADSIQVSVDTLQVLELQSDTMLVSNADSTAFWKQPPFLVSCAIAIFTGVYMVFTMRIFWKTEEQADAAKTSAKASREAAEASQEANRISKRATFYPIFEFDLDFFNKDPSKLKASISLLDENMMFKVDIFTLVWIDYEEIKEEKVVCII